MGFKKEDLKIIYVGSSVMIEHIPSGNFVVAKDKISRDENEKNAMKQLIFNLLPKEIKLKKDEVDFIAFGLGLKDKKPKPKRFLNIPDKKE